MRKGISPQKIAYLIFALIGAIIMLAIYINFAAQSQGGIFCSVYSNVYRILPQGDDPPPLPQACIKRPDTSIDTTRIISQEKSIVEDHLVEYIVSCYQKNHGYRNLTLPCYSLKIVSLAGEISELDITDNMEATGFICDTLGNSKIIDSRGRTIDYSSVSNKVCGTSDQITWVVHQNTIKKGDIVEIKYTDRKIKVIT
ncbi:MAG: hypothetical protein DRN71_04000 [Candidatus Nanohalarchaeota archaeon]|nr:MAG: hypothetical protein DRN71_04000 [Candidatus Nanohaloarchaeota archaeon]